MEPQVVITMPLLEGIDGIKKMSKSYNNYIGINEVPKDIFGKVMSVSDDLMLRYYELLTDCDLEEVKSMNPRDAKIGLGKRIVKQFHGEEAAEETWGEFEKVFVKRGLPEDMEVYSPGESRMNVVELMVKSGLAPSKNEARRIISQGAFKIDQKKITDDKLVLDMDTEYVLQSGKRKFIRVKKYIKVKGVL